MIHSGDMVIQDLQEGISHMTHGMADIIIHTTHLGDMAGIDGTDTTTLIPMDSTQVITTETIMVTTKEILQEEM